MTSPQIQPLSSPTRHDGSPWRCATLYAHDCAGPIVGKVGPIPCCAAGAAAELAVWERDAARVAAFTASPEGQRIMREEAAAERRIEGRP